MPMSNGFILLVIIFSAAEIIFGDPNVEQQTLIGNDWRNAYANKLFYSIDSNPIAPSQNAHLDDRQAHGVYSIMFTRDGRSVVIAQYPTQDDYSIDHPNISQHPFFDFGMPRNITARVGQTAFLNCRVEQLGDKSVSWIRKRDLHILTAGILTYTSDERFQVLRTEGSNDWTLQVKFSQPRDSGIYECQVNTEPKMSMAFRLNVVVSSVEARAIIVGPADLYVKAGSAITLTCLVRQAPHEIGPIHWYRGTFVITPFDIHPNDATIDLSRRISMESQLGDSLKSRLRIANAQTSDSGNYTCLPTTAEGASVMVHVINGEHPAAMQRGSASPLYDSSLVHIIYLVELIVHLLVL